MLSEPCPYHQDEAKKVYEQGFDLIIYTLYRTEETERTEEVLTAAAQKYNFVVWTAKEAFIDEDFVNIIKKTSIPLFTHTINDVEAIKSYQARGVDGFYSDLVDWKVTTKE